MADEKHLLLTISGHNSGTGLEAETWQVGIRWILMFGPGTVDPVGTLPTNWAPVAATISRDETDWTISGNWTVEGPGLAAWAPDDWLNDQVAPAMYDWMVGTKQATSVKVDSIKVYPIGAPTGRSVPAAPYAVGSPISLDYKTPYGAGSVSGALPLQNSIVCSHRSAQVGRSGRGRIFLPPSGSSILTNQLIQATPCQAIADAHAAFLEAGADIGGPPYLRPIVTGGNWTKYAVIQSVEVDNVMDTQRRRRKAVVGTKYTASTTY